MSTGIDFIESLARGSACRTVLLACWLLVPGAQAADTWQTMGTDGCTLFAQATQVDDGYGETPVVVEVEGSRLRVVTESNLDTTLGPLGLSVDGGEFIPADRVENGTDLVFETRVQQIVESFIRGSTAQLTLRFWPTWPQTGDKQVRFSLTGFTQAYNLRSSCG